MKTGIRRITARTTALLAVGALLLCGGLRTARADASVATATELSDALTAAALTPTVPATITFITDITTAGAITVPSYVTVNLGGNTWTVRESALNLTGTIAGGTLSLQGTASSAAALIISGSASYPTPVTNSYAAVRRSVSLQIENADAGSETVQSIVYTGGTTDETGYVCKTMTAGAVTIFAIADGTGTKAISSITTDVATYRLGTYNTNTISRVYSITYNLDGGTIPTTGTANPDSYTASDASATLTNPVKQGYTFAGWTGTGLDPDPTQNTSVTLTFSGKTGSMSFTANWTAQPGGGGTGGGGRTGGGTAAETDAEEEIEETPAETEALVSTEQSAQSGVRVARGTSATKVTFTGDTDAAIVLMPQTETPKNTVLWVWIAGGAAVLIGAGVAVAIVHGRRRNREDAE